MMKSIKENYEFIFISKYKYADKIKKIGINPINREIKLLAIPVNSNISNLKDICIDYYILSNLTNYKSRLNQKTNRYFIFNINPEKINLENIKYDDESDEMYFSKYFINYTSCINPDDIINFETVKYKDVWESYYLNIEECLTDMIFNYSLLNESSIIEEIENTDLLTNKE